MQMSMNVIQASTTVAQERCVWTLSVATLVSALKEPQDLSVQ